MVILISCKAQQVSIAHVEWKLVKMVNADLSLLDQPVTLTLDETNKKISGYAGCNSFFGTYQSTGSNISFTGLGSTKIFCQDKMKVEDTYFSSLVKIQSFKMKHSKLYLLYEGHIVLEFSK